MSTQPPPKKAAPIVAIKQYVEARASNLSSALKGTGVDIERFMVLALNQTLQTPLLLQCTPASWFDAMQKAATHGLLPDGIHAALVPYKFTDKNAKPVPLVEYRVQFIPMYQGLVQRAYQTEIVGKIWADVVYADDEFVMEKGSNPKLVHIPSGNDRNDDKLIGVYACAKIKDEVHFEFLFPRDVKRHENASKSSDGASSPWQTAKAEMWKKTAIIALSKVLPHFNAKGLKYAQLVAESEREDLALPAPIDVNFLPDAPTGLDPLKERLRAQAEGLKVPVGALEAEKQSVQGEMATEQTVRALDPDAADAEKEPAHVVKPGKLDDGSPCGHEPMRGWPVSKGKQVMCSACRTMLDQRDIAALGAV